VILSAASAALSIYFPTDPLSLSQVSVFSQQLSSFSHEPSKVPILPGLYFGFVIGFAVYVIERDMLRASAAVVAIVFAWILAFETAVKVISVVDTSQADNPASLLAGPAAGFVGSVISVVGLSLICSNFRGAKPWFRTIMIGTAAGLMLNDGYLFKLAGMSWIVEGHYHLKDQGDLFAVWQPTVAASIAYGLIASRRQPSKQSALEALQPKDVFDQVARLARLHRDGDLTDDEFIRLKRSLIGPEAAADNPLHPRKSSEPQ
jgi:hypothetical protein